MMSVLDEIKAAGNAKIQNEGNVARLIESLLEGGTAGLQVIVDFDYTLTRVHRDGKRLPASWEVFEASSFVDKSFVEKTTSLRNRYHPIETDAHLSIEEKVPRMVEWYTQANQLLKECGTVKRGDFKSMVEQSNVELREGTRDMLGRLQEAGVPVLVFSAGLGDVVEEILVAKKAKHANTTFLSNFVKFDGVGNVAGMAGDVIHVFNKNERSLKNALNHRSDAAAESTTLREVGSRHNVLLMGDSLGDARMADGVDNPAAVLKIGFLNHGVESEPDKVRLRKYLEAFDIVLVDDQTMNVASVILRAIANYQPK